MPGKALLLCTVIVLALGCAGPKMKDMVETPPSDPAVETQDANIARLDNRIGGLIETIAEVEKTPASSDPILQEIRVKDLSGLKLHKKQLLVLREHCRFARAQLLLVKKKPEERGRIQEEWARHEEALMSKLLELEKEKDLLAKERIELELQLIRRNLQ
jgi:hypothetical protein